MRKIFLFLLLLVSSVAIACKCDTPPFSADVLKSYELIFTGEVTAISGCDKTANVTFAVKELYKGKCFANVSVEFDCSSSCQMSFEPGQAWIIFATYKKYGEAEVNLCSHSRRKFVEEKDDFYLQMSGMTFEETQASLKKNLGVQELNVKAPEAEQHHENIRPGGYETLWYLAAGFIALIAFYFLGRKFLK
ncbi:MAG: hypothetical protein M3R17_17950 [Bacteroidota bacterium]|nr:hypothetical protein [Bacteroidota bacterium]